MQSLFITGFGPFGEFNENPSEQLVRGLVGYRTHILPVSFQAVDTFLADERLDGTSDLLMLGVSAKATHVMLEKIARNQVGRTPDTMGMKLAEVAIHPESPPHYEGKLFVGWERMPDCWEISVDAGDYLCNYLYFEATRRRPQLRTGFVHVPPFSVLPFEVQQSRLRLILDKIETQPQ